MILDHFISVSDATKDNRKADVYRRADVGGETYHSCIYYRNSINRLNLIIKLKDINISEAHSPNLQV